MIYEVKEWLAKRNAQVGTALVYAGQACMLARGACSPGVQPGGTVCGLLDMQHVDNMAMTCE